MEVVQKYTVDFHKVLSDFNLLPQYRTYCYQTIIEQIEIIEDLIGKDLAYEINGSVYFDVLKYNNDNNYGILSGRNLKI